MFLQDNSLTSTIPKNIGDMQSLEWIDVTNNALVGTLPEDFYSLANLNFAYMSNNTFSGTISADLESMSSLNDLWLDGNQFSGTFPSIEIGNLLGLGKNLNSHIVKCSLQIFICISHFCCC